MKKLVLSTILLLSLPNISLAAMQSMNFRIYDSANDAQPVYAGPVITNLATAVTDSSVTVSWTTAGSLSDGYVVYSTDAGLLTATDVGSAIKNTESHTVQIGGLNASTVYYYKVKSTGLFGGTGYSSIGSFTTAAKPVVPTVTPPTPAGGGMLVIDKTDKVAPIITGVKVAELNFDSAVIYWKSNENSSSFVEYNSPDAPGMVTGDWQMITEHYIRLENLKPETLYNFRVLGADASGNLAKSEFATFKTLKDGKIGEPVELPKKPEEVVPVKPPLTVRIDDLPTAIVNLIQALTKYRYGAKLSEFEKTTADFLLKLKNITSSVPGPRVIGRPDVKFEGNRATFTWQTDKVAGSQIALATNAQYRPQDLEPYYLFQGDTDTLKTQHNLEVYGLIPSTQYHFQVRSRSALDITSRSDDYTFKTPDQMPGIINYSFEVVSIDKVIFRWVTTEETDSAVTATPMNGLNPDYTKSKTEYDKVFNIIHQIQLSNLPSDTTFQIELSGKTKNSVAVSRKIDNFSTTKDVSPPLIDQIKAEVAYIPGKQEIAQAIVSWTTNELSTSKVYYIKGATNFEIKDAKLIEDGSYTTKHVAVINKLESGQVYSYRVASTDINKNEILSSAHTVYVSGRPESVFDLIVKYFKQMFGWMENIRR